MTDTTPGDSTPTPKGTGAGLLSRKVGGVKVQWLILIAAVAVVGGILYRRYKTAHATTTAAPVTITAPATDTGPTTGDGVYSTAGGGNLGGSFTYSGNGAGTSTYSTLSTNAQWATAAANGLVGQGQYAALDVENALANFLAGTPLTPAQTAIINTAIAAYGSPPEAVLASTSTPVPAPAATAPAPAPAPELTGFYRLKNGEIYAQYSDGQQVGFPTLAAYKAAGSPHFTQLPY